MIDGLDADVVTLALAYDIDEIAARAKLLPSDWQKRLPHNSSPYTSTIVFLVRKGNPKAIRDWNDLVRPGVSVITPNPKTSGGARWNYLAAWAYALRQPGGNETKAREFVAQLYRNVPVLDSGARGSTDHIRGTRHRRCVRLLGERGSARGQGARTGEVRDRRRRHFQSWPSRRSRWWIDNADRKGTRATAQAYLEFLYTPEGQEIIARNHYRPTDKVVAAKYAKEFPDLKMVTIDEAFGGWGKAQATHFADGGGVRPDLHAWRH